MIINNYLIKKKLTPIKPQEHTVLQVRTFGSLDTVAFNQMYVNGVLIEPNLTHVDENGFREYFNSYDNYFPYNVLKEDYMGDNVFVKIPKCYIKYVLNESGEIIGYDISNEMGEGYVKHPGTYGKEFIGFGKYQGSYYLDLIPNKTYMKSISGVDVQFGKTRADYREKAAANGAGYHSLGVFEWQLLQLLMTHYFGTTNSDNYFPDISGGEQPTGAMDGIKTGYRLSDGKNVFFGIENIIKNGYHWLDGININNRVNYVNYDYTTWEDDTTSNYINVGTSPSTSDYIKAFGLGNNNIMFPTIIGGTDKTYFADNYYQSTGWRVLYSGSSWSSLGSRGLFYWYASFASSGSGSVGGARLCFSPT